MAIFNLNDALNGALIGIPVASEEELSRNSGHLRLEDSKRIVYIDGHKISVSTEGVVRACTPADNRFTPGTVLQIIEKTISTTYGSKQTQTRSPTQGYDPEANLSNMEPRDYFALEAMRVMMQNTPHPDAADDATILFVARAAYRWAQGMIIAAADTRLGTAQSSGTTPTQVDVTDGTNTEKLLDNLVKAISTLTTAIQGTLKVETPSGSSLNVEGEVNVQGVNDTSTSKSIPLRVHGITDDTTTGFVSDPIKTKAVTT